MLNHLAVIMDGNGRWANARNLPRIAGHKKGAESARSVIEQCGELGIRYLTLYAFSSENWQRSKEEVNGLMDLLRFYLSRELQHMHKQGAKLRFIGDHSPLSSDIRKQIKAAEALTKDNDRIQINVALSYGSRQEITDAVKALAKQVESGSLSAEDITAERLEQQLYTADSPAPDLLIRTGGEQRLSNFLLWQSAYTELYFTDTLWPDFGKEALEKAIECFTQRERRFGRAEEKSIPASAHDHFAEAEAVTSHV